MSWHYLREGEAVCSPHIYWDGKRSQRLKSIPIAEKSSCKDNAIKSLNLSRSGMTSERLIRCLSRVVLMWLAGDSPVRISARQVKVKDCPGNVQALFSKCSELLRQYNLSLFSRKTLRFCAPVVSTLSSENLTAWGIMLAGECWELGTSVHRTKEKECGSLPNLPTPTAQSYGSNRGGAAGRTGKVRHSLQSMASQNNWPTPRASDADRGGRGELLGKIRGTKGYRGIPTPTARDYKDGSAQSCKNVPVNCLLGRHVHTMSNTQQTGSLNPNWVEWLMGWPIGWTESKPLAMGRFRSWLALHGISSVKCSTKKDQRSRSFELF